MKVLFYGTPEFALPTLEILLQRHRVVAVVTQPDRPAHRGQKLTAPPVKERALAAPSRMRATSALVEYPGTSGSECTCPPRASTTSAPTI